MNRRKAIGSLLLASIGGAAALSGYKWHDWHKTPDISWLEQHKDLVSALAETILPETSDSPGARTSGVADYIFLMIRDCTERISANKFIDGLKDLDSYCRSRYQKAYPDCDPDSQIHVLRHFEEKGKPFKGIIGKVQDRYLGKSFFTTLKELTVAGYCSSETGATKGLSYLYIPGAYHGCITMTPGQRAWATK
jgi:hypothetical protein